MSLQSIVFLFLGIYVPVFTSTPPGDTPVGVPTGSLLHLNAWGLEGVGGLSLPASVPGDIVSDLQSAGLIPDPYYLNNTRTVSPLWDELFTYSTAFNIPALPVWESAYYSAGGSLYLVLEGAKMVADVSVNGVALGDVRSQFVRRIIPLPKSSLAPTNNLLQVAFPPSSDARNTEGRFMACSGNWDWAPLTTTATQPTAAAPQGLPTFTKGLWRSAYLFSLPANTAAITHLVLSTLLTASNASNAPAQYPTDKLEDGSNGPWRVRATVHFLCAEDTQGTLTLQGSWSQGLPTLSNNITLPAGNSTVEVFLSARNVGLWWPAGLGLGQALYTVSATFTPLATPLEGRVTTSRTMGFRAFYLVTASEDAGVGVEGVGRLGGSGTLTLRYKCNGLDLWIRGANLVPLEDMEGRLSTEGLRGLVFSAVQGGMNALRVWGGGVYQPDAFYDAADQAGLLLLHDLAYANERFLPSNTTTQADEIAHSVRRLAHHPSVVVFHGGNELEPINSPGQELVAAFALPAVAAEVDDRPLWPASPSAGWASGVDRLTGLPNGKEPLIPLRRNPSSANCVPAAPAPKLAQQQQGHGTASMARITPPGSPPFLSPPPPCGPNCTYIPFATTPYKAGGDATLRNVSSPTQCMAACLALPPTTCVCALWDGVLCFLRGTGLLDRFWASDALWPDRSGPLPTLPADFHGPYYSPGGRVRTVSSPSGESANWSSGFPLLLPPPAPLGVNLPGVFNSEFGVTSPPSFENIAPSLPPDQWGLTGPGLFWRNYACDGAFATYFPSATPNFSQGIGPSPFQAQLYLCSVAHTLKLASLLEPTRAQNYMGSLIWQLNEVWDTVGWGSLEYGGGQRGSVVGGRWKMCVDPPFYSSLPPFFYLILLVLLTLASLYTTYSPPSPPPLSFPHSLPTTSLHYALARTLFGNVFTTCGANGACFVRNDHPLESLMGGELQVQLIDTMTGKPCEGGTQFTLPLTLPPGPAQIAWGCLTGGDPASPSGCAPLAPYLASQACAAGLSCVALCTVRDGKGAVVASNTAFFASPGALHLPSDDLVRLSVAVAGEPNGDGTINVTVASNSSALFIHLTSAAQGRFSDSGFHLFGVGLRDLVFLPSTPQEYNTLVDTLRVEHLRTYF